MDDQLARLAAMSSAELKAEWRRVMRSDPPLVSPDLLERALAYHLQVRRSGGLATATRRSLDRLVREMKRTDTVTPSRDTSLKPGTRLSRDWHGRTHHVVVLEDGYLYDERRFRSLSQIACAITGAQWSGPRFFGLKRSGAVNG